MGLGWRGGESPRAGVIDAVEPPGDPTWVRVLLHEPWPDQENRLVNVPIERVVVE